MLQCTQAAASTIRQLRRQQAVPEAYGLRVFPTPASSGEVTIGLGFVESPVQGDQVNEVHGQRLFVAPEIADQLDELALDVTDDASNDGAAPTTLALVPAAGAD